MKKIQPYMLLTVLSTLIACAPKTEPKKPNILFCIADDWGWPHAGVYGDMVVKTPAFDKLATEGLLFENAFVSSPSCTPSRSAILTGQQFWRLGQSANLWSTLDSTIPVYPILLEKSGYHIGSWRKSWGPGDLEVGGYTTTLPAGKKYEGFKAFLDARPADSPFCFWLGASDPHRGYERGSGEASGMDIDQVKVPKFYPDVPEIRSDIADYYYEVQRFDSDVANAIQLLDSIGELENTIIVVTGDHGMPFPRCKANLYDMGVRVPLVIKMGKNLNPKKGRIIDFVSLTDLAPTFLNLAGLEVPAQMTGKSLEPILNSGMNSLDTLRNHVVFGRERHTPAQLRPSLDGYPSRAIRTTDYLYIRNFHPERWPAGVPENSTHSMNTFSDCDNGPTKFYLMENATTPGLEPFFNWSFAKRPAEELYHMGNDPDQLVNLASDPDYGLVKKTLAKQLSDELTALEDPRVLGGKVEFDSYPYRVRNRSNKSK
nr:sulfatase [Allomuricauda sp.]